MTPSQTWARPLPGNVAIIVIDSGLKHDLVTGDDNLRRAECCEQAARRLGVDFLCTLKSDALARLRGGGFGASVLMSSVTVPARTGHGERGG